MFHIKFLIYFCTAGKPNTNRHLIDFILKILPVLVLVVPFPSLCPYPVSSPPSELMRSYKSIQFSMNCHLIIDIIVIRHHGNSIHEVTVKSLNSALSAITCHHFDSIHAIPVLYRNARYPNSKPKQYPKSHNNSNTTSNPNLFFF
jgi:hypothetical protein